jgi:hypothetical protein
VQAIVVMAKSSVALLSTVKSVYDVLRPMADPSIELAKDGLSAVLGSTAGAIGTVISAYVLVTQSHSARRTHRRLKSVDNIKSKYKRMDTGNPEFDPVLLQYMRYGSHKLIRKRGQHIGRAVSAGFGVVGGVGGTTATILTATGVIAAANAWNPVGWAIGGVGLTIGIGLSVYMIRRRHRKKKLRAKREATAKPLDKEQFVAMLVAAYVDEDYYKANSTQWREVSSVLTKLNALVFTKDVNKIVDFRGQYVDVASSIAAGVKKL